MSEEQYVEDLILLAKLKGQQRKHPPGEKPDCTVLIKTVHPKPNVFLGEYNKTTRHWYDDEGWPYEDSEIDGWWHIKHLVGEEE